MIPPVLTLAAQLTAGRLAELFHIAAGRPDGAVGAEVPDVEAVTTAIDVSHCVPFWGGAFRPAPYWKLATLGTATLDGGALIQYNYAQNSLDFGRLWGVHFLEAGVCANRRWPLFLWVQEVLLLVIDFLIVTWGTTLALVPAQVQDFSLVGHPL